MSASSLAIPVRRVRSLRMPRPELSALLVLAAVLDLWALSRNGWANDYYSAAVHSMSTSWHAFFYGSFDASGVMTVDKPPLALWVEALSVRAFGYSSWSMLVPQALMGIASVGLTYDLVRRRFGRAAGAVGGLVLALTPVTVAISRHNNPDALLVLCCVAALWALVRGLEDGRTRWLVLSGLCVGLGFETKMLVAFMVVPGIALAWLVAAPRGRGRLDAFRQLLAGGAVMMAAALAWPMLMWLTPASSRPWIAGTTDNSIWSLIFGYNGFGRILGQSGGPGGGTGGPGGGGGGNFGGSPGFGRLLNDALGGQAGWLLGTALVVGGVLLVSTRLRRSDARTGWLLAVGGSFLVTAVAFSKASGIFHPYYVSLLAPFTAALVGAGAGMVVSGDRVMRIGAPLAIAGGVITELIVLHENTGTLTWLAPVLVLVAVAASVVWLAPGIASRMRRAALAAALAVLLIAPGTWAFQTLGHATSGTFPAGGPANAVGDGFGGGGGPGGGRGFGVRAFGPGGPPSMSGTGSAARTGVPGAFAPGGSAQTGGSAPGGATQAGGGMFGGTTQSLTKALAYAKAHGGGAVAVSSQMSASGSIISSGANIVAIGGFSGRETQVTVSWLADEVASGKIRYVLTDGTSGGGMPGDSRVGAKEVMTVVAKVGKKVSSISGLYDLQGLAAQLLAAA